MALWVTEAVLSVVMVMVLVFGNSILQQFTADIVAVRCGRG